jgi:hypothetical protein
VEEPVRFGLLWDHTGLDIASALCARAVAVPSYPTVLISSNPEEGLETGIRRLLEAAASSEAASPPWGSQASGGRTSLVVTCDLGDPTHIRSSLSSIEAILRELAGLQNQPAYGSLLRDSGCHIIALLPMRPVEEGSQHAAQLYAWFLDVESALKKQGSPFQRVLLLAPSNYHKDLNPKGYVSLLNPATGDLTALRSLSAELVYQIVAGDAWQRLASLAGSSPFFWASAASLLWDGYRAGTDQARAALADVCREFLDRGGAPIREEVLAEMDKAGLSAGQIVRALARPAGTGPHGAYEEVRLEWEHLKCPAGKDPFGWSLELPYRILLEQDQLERHRLPRAVYLIRGERDRIVAKAEAFLKAQEDRWQGVPEGVRPPDPQAGARRCREGLKLLQALLEEELRSLERQTPDGGDGSASARGQFSWRELIPQVDPGLRRLARRIPDQAEPGPFWERLTKLLQYQPRLAPCLGRGALIGLPLASLAGLLAERYQYGTSAPPLGAAPAVFPSLVFLAVFALSLGASAGHWGLWQLRIKQAKERLLIVVERMYRRRVTEEVTRGVRSVLLRLIAVIGKPATSEEPAEGEYAVLQAWEDALRQAAEDHAVAGREQWSASQSFSPSLEAPASASWGDWGGKFSAPEECAHLVEKGWSTRWREPSQWKAAIGEWLEILRVRGFRYLERATVVEILGRHEEGRRREIEAELGRKAFPFSLHDFTLHPSEKPKVILCGPGNGDALNRLLPALSKEAETIFSATPTAISVAETYQEPSPLALSVVGPWRETYAAMQSKDPTTTRALHALDPEAGRASEGASPETGATRFEPV